MFSHALEGIAITAADGTIMDVNQPFTRISGYSREEVLDGNPRMFGSGRQDKAFYAAFWQSLTELGQWSGELWSRRKNGEVYVALQPISAVRDENGQITCCVALCSDITRRKEQEVRLEHMAHFDALTGLSNRVLQADRLRQAMAQAVRWGMHLARVYIDLDGFKAINATYGHAAGVFRGQHVRPGDTQRSHQTAPRHTAPSANICGWTGCLVRAVDPSTAAATG